MSSTDQDYVEVPARRRVRRRWLAAVCCAAATVGVVVGLVGISTGSATAAGKVYKITFATAFIGNDSQPQSGNIVRWIAKHVAPYNKQVKFSEVLASATTVPAQLASLEGVLRTKPDGIILFPFSDTALNGLVTQACNEGIKVVAEDLTVTAPCAYNQTYNTTGVGDDQASFMCTVLHGHGTVLVDRGQPAGSVAKSEVAARVSYLKTHCPGVTVAGYFTGEYTPGIELTSISAALAAHPNVNGVMSDYSCSADLLAEKHAGLKYLPNACYAVNGNAIACVADHVNCLLYSDPTTEFGEAMKELLGLFAGKSYPHFAALSQPTFIVKPIKFTHVLPVATLAAGVNYYPALSVHLCMPLGNKDFPQITASIALGTTK